MIWAVIPQRAEAESAGLSGPGSVYSGDTIAITFSVYGGDNVVAINGSFSCDGVYLYDYSSSRSGWTVVMEGNNFTAYDTTASNPVSGSSSILVAYFRLRDGVGSGDSLGVSVYATCTDGETTSGSFSASWSATIAAPLSGNADLASLTCGNATLSPSFSAGTTSYSCTVPYEVTWLDLHYSVADSGADAWISGNDLSVGDNTVSIGVEAANGNVKYYNIYVTRQQDPNYKPSTNAKLSSLSPSTGRLSPAFDPDVSEYVIYLPYEVESFSLTGTAQDSKALSVTDASAELKPGDNPVSVVCTAEDGTTKATYTVHVYRMPAFAGVMPQIIDPNTADYRAVDAALEKVPTDLTDYTEESVTALKAAMAAVVRNLPKEEQAKVDAMAKALEKALAGLEEKPAPVVLTPWQKLLAAGDEAVEPPLIGRFTGPVPLKFLLLPVLVLLALLLYLLGMLVGRRAGRKKALRQLNAPDDNGPDDGGPDGGGPDGGGEPPAPDQPPAAAPVPEAPLAEEAPAEEPIAEEPIAEEPVTEEAPAEAPAVEEMPAAEAPAEEPVAADVPAEEPVAADVPAEDPAPSVIFAAEKPPVADTPRETPPEAASEEKPPLFVPPKDGIPPVEDPISRMTLDELLEDIKKM